MFSDVSTLIVYEGTEAILLKIKSNLTTQASFTVLGNRITIATALSLYTVPCRHM